MRKLVLAGIFVFLLIAGGCAPAPKTAAEFRSGVQAGMFAHAHEHVEVNASTKKVSDLLEKMGNECLDISINRRVDFGGRVGHSYWDYSTEMKREKESSEFVLRLKLSGNVLSTQKEPEGGYYVLLADVKATGKKKSEVDIYYQKYQVGEAAKAIKSWLIGVNRECPDMTLALGG